MGSQPSKCFEGSATTPGNPASFMFQTCSPSTCTHLTKWTDITKSNLEYQVPLWGTFELPKWIFLKTELDSHGSKIVKTEWYTYFDWYFEAFRPKLTEANKQLKEGKKPSEASLSPPPFSSSPDILHTLYAQALPLVSSFFPSVPTPPPLYPVSPF